MRSIRTGAFVYLTILSGGPSFSVELDDVQKREMSIKFYGDAAAKEVKKLAEIEKEISVLPQQDAAVVALNAAGLLNTKLSSLGYAELNSGKPYTREQLAYISAIALARLSVLAQVAKQNSAAICHLAESNILLDISQSKKAEPANCRPLAYSPEIQARQASVMQTVQGDELNRLANSWAKLAGMYAYSIANLKQFGVADKTSGPAKQERADGPCEKANQWFRTQAVAGQEIALLRASNGLLQKVTEVNTKQNATSEDQLWAYKIFAIGNATLEKEAQNSPRVKNILKSFSDRTVEMITGKINFEKFKDEIVVAMQKAEQVDKANQQIATTFLPTHASQIKAFTQCTVVSAMYNATRK